MGWGPGRSRFIEPKRHFVKPLALSPLIAIDRERCILCYRCVRFSQEISEDYQLVLQERSAATYVSTFDGHPYVAPFSGNIIELCPVGRADVAALPLPRAAVGHRGLGLGLHAVPGAVQRRVHGPRRARPARALARPRRRRRRLALRQGPLRLPVRPRRLAGDPSAAARRRRARAGRAGIARSTRPRTALRAAGADTGAIAGGETTNEEGFLLAHLMRGALGSNHIDSRAGGTLPRELHAALHAPALQATVPDLEFAHAVLVLDCEPVDDAPVLDLRIRKGVRRNGVQLARRDEPAVVAGSERQGRRALRARRRRGVLRRAERRARRQRRRRGARRGRGRRRRRGPRARRAALRRRRGRRHRLRRAPDATAPRGDHAARALLNVAGRVVTAGHDGCGLLELPAGTNGRGLREVGVLPNAGPGLTPVSSPGLDSARDRRRRGGQPARGALPAARRPAARPARPPAVEEGAGAREDGRRARGVPHRGALGARRHRLPRGVLRREGGDGHAPRRARAAAAPGDRAARRGARRVVGARGPLQAPGPRPRRADRPDDLDDDVRRDRLLRRA